MTPYAAGVAARALSRDYRNPYPLGREDFAATKYAQGWSHEDARLWAAFKQGLTS